MKLHADGSFNWKNQTAYWAVVEGDKLVANGQEVGSSSNRAELLGAINALAIPGVEVVCVDSKYVASIFSGEFKKLRHNQDLVEKLLAFQGRAKIEWIPREQNQIADMHVGKLAKGRK